MGLSLHTILIFIQRSVSLIGIIIILTGVIVALYHYIRHCFSGSMANYASHINVIRLNLGRVLILGLEFIVASDLIGTTTAPDYYSLGIAAIIVFIRTLLSFSINREIASVSHK